MKERLSPAQQRLLSRMNVGVQYSAYTLGTSLATLRALERKGVLRDVTRPGPGGMFSPRTHYKFMRKPAGNEGSTP